MEIDDQLTSDLGMEESPSYWVEHLATFAVGREFGNQINIDLIATDKILPSIYLFLIRAGIAYRWA